MPMNLKMDNVYLLFCLLSLMVFEMSAKTLQNRNECKRQKRAIVESSECQQSIAQTGMTLFNIGIGTLKEDGTDIDGNFFGKLKLIYNRLESNPKSATVKIEEELGKFKNKEDECSKTLHIDSANLKSELIRLYTCPDYYTNLNNALNQHSCTYKKLPLDDDENALAAYATALFAVLIYWPELNTCSEITYRGFSVSNIKETLKYYKEGNIVVFKAFTSSSTIESEAFKFMTHSVKNILLVFDNSQNNFWKPRDIKPHSVFKYEKECLYPPAAKFRVTSIPRIVSKEGKDYREIHLQTVEETPTDTTSLLQFSGYTILCSIFLTSTFM